MSIHEKGMNENIFEVSLSYLNQIVMGYWPEKDTTEDARKKRIAKQKSENSYTPFAGTKRPTDDNLPSSVDPYLRDPLNDINLLTRERIFKPASQTPPIYSPGESKYASNTFKNRNEESPQKGLAIVALLAAIIGGGIGYAVAGPGGLTVGACIGGGIAAYPLWKDG
jgi:hypothetical protein